MGNGDDLSQGLVTLMACTKLNLSANHETPGLSSTEDVCIYIAPLWEYSFGLLCNCLIGNDEVDLPTYGIQRTPFTR